MTTNTTFIQYTFYTAVGCVLLALLPGCALTKTPQHTQIVQEALPAKAAIPAAWVAGADSNSVSSNWLKSFNDPGLDTIVAEAIANNPDLRKAATAVQIAQQNVIIVASKMKVQVGVDMGYDVMIDDGHKGAYQSTKALGLVAWEPDIWGKLRAQLASSDASYHADSLDFIFGRQSLAATTAKSWYVTVETNQLANIAQQEVKVYTDMLALVKMRRGLGKVSDLDVAEASANVNAAQNALLQANGMVAEARRDLEVLIGRYPAAQIVTAQNFIPLPPPIHSGLPSLLLERRPDLLAAEKQVLAAFRNEEAARLALLPSFSMNLGGGRMGDKLLSLLQLNPWMLGGGIGMMVPVYTGGRLPAMIKIATAEQEAAVAGYGAIALKSFREVENGLMNEGLLAERLLFEQNVLTDRTEALRIATIKYNAGSIDLLSVLQLQGAQIVSRVALIKIQNAQLINRINLHLALGGSFD